MPPVWQQTAAVRDFDPGNVRLGSFTTEEVEAARSCMSALPPKADIRAFYEYTP
jgi:hypothetical protein